MEIQPHVPTVTHYDSQAGLARANPCAFWALSMELMFCVLAYISVMISLFEPSHWYTSHYQLAHSRSFFSESLHSGASDDLQISLVCLCKNTVSFYCLPIAIVTVSGSLAMVRN